MNPTEFEDFGRMLSQMEDLRQQVVGGRLSLYDVQRGLQQMLAGDQVVGCQPPSYFAPLARQLANIERWNEDRGWGFSPELIARRALEARTFNWPGDRLQAIVLVPSLASPGETLRELLSLSVLRVWPQDAANVVDRKDDGVTLVDGVEFKPNTLEWRLVNLGTHQQHPRHIPEDAPLRHAWRDGLVTAENAAHAEVVAAAAHFPLWLKAVQQKHVPQVVVPGYRIARPEHGSTDGAAINVESGSHFIHLYATVGEDNTVWRGKAVATAGPVPLGDNI